MAERTIAQELGDYDQEYGPKHLAIMPGLDSLIDGVYIMDITGSQLTRAQDGRPILEAMLRVISGPTQQITVQHTYWLNSQDGIDRLGGDLVALGIEADLWTGKHGKRFSVELVKALPRLRAIRFQAKKRTSPNEKKPEKPYHNLDVLFSLDRAAQAAVAASPAAATPATPAISRPTVATHAARQSALAMPESDIPFSIAPFFPWIAAALTIGGYLA